MWSFPLTENVEFHAENPFSQPLFVSDWGRVLRFSLNPGQSIREHGTPHSPFFAVVLEGEGLFSGEDGQEQRFGPHSLLIFAPGERHTVRALDQKLVFVGFLHAAPGVKPGTLSGEIVRQ
jgi:quercetin dioxygenase-like cupin family protein